MSGKSWALQHCKSMNVRETGQAPFLTPPPKDTEIQLEQFLKKNVLRIFLNLKTL